MNPTTYIIEDNGLQDILLTLHHQTTHLEPLYRNIADALRTMVDLEFRNQEDPWGKPWEPLADSTLAQRRQKGKGAKILRDTGTLQNSLAPFFGLTGVTLGTNVPYGPHHQYGIGSFLPRRAFLPLNEQGAASFSSDVLLKIMIAVNEHFKFK